VHPNQIAMQLFHHSMPPTPDDDGSTVSMTAIREGGVAACNRAPGTANNGCSDEEMTMIGLIAWLRRSLIHCRLRTLQWQENNIIRVRNYALARLVEVRRERGIKEVELWLYHFGDKNSGAT
jgi:hypothetical protein